MTKPAREFVTAETVAQLIGFSGGPAFLRERHRLETQEGFPEPLPTCRRPMTWRRSAVAAWVDQLGTADMPPATYGNVVLLREARR